MLNIEPRIGKPVSSEEMRQRLGPARATLATLHWSKCTHPAGWYVLVAPVSSRLGGIILRESLPGAKRVLPRPGFELNLGELPSEATLWLENRAGVYWLKIV